MTSHLSSVPPQAHEPALPSVAPRHAIQGGSYKTVRKCRSVSRDPRSVSKRFNDARLSLGWTQLHCARRYNVTRRTVIGWCNGRFPIAASASISTNTSAGMILDVPWSGNGENKGVRVTQYYSGGAIYCLTPTDEETARRVASYSEPLPAPSQLQLPEELDDEVPW